MRNLWTPWRSAHVCGETPTVQGCLFEPPGDESARLAELLLYRDRHNLVLLNRFPYSNGHLLVAPLRHVANLTDLSADEAGRLMTLVREATTILAGQLHPEGFNIGCNIGACAGAGIADHLHVHIVPRWSGDHNFLCVLAEVRTIPEHLETTFHRLLPDFLDLRERCRP
jgi:ATP adenylyltransferase